MTPPAPLRQPLRSSLHRSMRPNRRGRNPVARRAGRLYLIPVQTLDPVQPAILPGARVSPAVARNTGPILDVLKVHLAARANVLEIASGSGEHAVAFARALPDTIWTPSDPSEEARASIAAWAGEAHLPNLHRPLALDAADASTWPDAVFHAVVCVNMIHISPWSATEGLMAGAGRVLTDPGGLLVLYGPFREAETPIAESNAAFDQSLKARDATWGLRDRDAVVTLAKGHHLHLTRRVEMPANNLMLLFRRA